MVEVMQMKFLRPSVEFSKLDCEKNADVMETAVLEDEECIND